MKKIKSRLFEIMETASPGDKASQIFDWFIIVLIIMNVTSVIASTFSVPASVTRFMNWFELFSVIIFTAEYILRLWTADAYYPSLSPLKARIKYLFSFMAVIDLLAILPFYLPLLIPVDLRILRILRLFRLLRLLKVDRYTHAFSTIGAVFVKKKNQLLSSVFFVFILMILSSVLMYYTENPAQPAIFKDAFSGLWWSICTLTTVGYGDIIPVTVAGKILSGIISILGIGMVAVPTGIISAGFMEHVQKENKEQDKTKSFCPYCGEKIK